MKKVLITGASKGIGNAIAKELAQRGYLVMPNYNHSEKEAKCLQKELQEKGYQIQIKKADVSNPKEAEELVKETIEKLGNIDILINNAGISQIKLFTDITVEEWNHMINTNMNSLFYVTKNVLPQMIQQKQGCIINISSIWGMTGASCEAHYSTAKAGMIGFTKALAKEVAPSQIRVNCIAPGMIDTQMNQELTEQERREIVNQIPLGRVGNVIDIVKCVNWLIEDNYTTGQIISPNGGWVIS